MARGHHNSGRSGQVMVVVVAVLVVGTLLPPKALAPVGWAGSTLKTLVAPVSSPVRWVTGWLDVGRAENDRELDVLLRDLELTRRNLDQATSRVKELEGQIEFLQGGVGVLPSAPVRQVYARVIGVGGDISSGLLTLGIGSGSGVRVGDVAAARDDAYQLVGRVVSVGAMSASVRVLTSGHAESMRGRIVLRESDGWGPFTQLDAVGDGTLRGPVEIPEDQPGGLPIEVGMSVRVDDPTMPAGAQSLLIGRVVAVEESPENPQRSIVVVEPALDVTRVRQVLLRLPADGGGG